MEKIGYVYLTTNLVNGKQYVGQHLHNGFDKYYKGSGTAITHAINKYGWDNFSCEVICWCATQTQLNEAEDNYIKLLETMFPKGYNLRGGGSHGKNSEEARKHISDALKGREGVMKGKKHSEESRKKMSDAGKGRTPWNKGLKMDDEICAKLSNSHKGQTPWNTGKHWSKDNRKKMSEAHKGQVAWNKGKTGIYNEESLKQIQTNQPNIKTVYQYDKNWNLVNVWVSLSEAGRAGYHSGCVSSCCRGEMKTYKGCFWRFEKITKPLLFAF